MPRYLRAAGFCALALTHVLVFSSAFVFLEFSSGGPMAFAQGGGGGGGGGAGGGGGGSGSGGSGSGGSGSGSGGTGGSSGSAGSGGSGGSGGSSSSASTGGSGVSGASGAGVGAPGPSGTSNADGLSPDVSVAGETGGIAALWAPRRLLQTSGKAAFDAAHYAAVAEKAAAQRSE